MATKEIGLKGSCRGLKKQGTNLNWVLGGESLLCDFESELHDYRATQSITAVITVVYDMICTFLCMICTSYIFLILVYRWERQ